MDGAAALRACSTQQDLLAVILASGVLHLDGLIAPEAVRLIQTQGLARRTLSCSVDPRRKRLPIDPKVSLAVTLERQALVDPVPYDARGNPEFHLEFGGGVIHRQQARQFDDDRLRDLDAKRRY